MKKLAALLMIFSLALVNVGCEPADETDTAPAGNGAETDPGAMDDETEGEVGGAG